MQLPEGQITFPMAKPEGNWTALFPLMRVPQLFCYTSVSVSLFAGQYFEYYVLQTIFFSNY